MKGIVLFALVGSAIAGLFTFEKQQLQAHALQHLLSPADAALFRGRVAIGFNRTLDCKVFPGDSAWPNSHAWDVLNDVTENSLIASVPRASSCYNGPKYNSSDCEYLTSRWNDSYFQCVLLQRHGTTTSTTTNRLSQFE